MEKSLLVGCGKARHKQVYLPGKKEWAGRLVTLDINPEVHPDLEWDMERRPLPFNGEEFDEIGAYHCLEHWGRQGDWRGWFDEMAEYHRLLKWGGEFSCAVPVGSGAVADPGHTRFFHPNHFCFLRQAFYTENEAAGTHATDYRFYWKLNFEIVHSEVKEREMFVLLRKDRVPDGR